MHLPRITRMLALSGLTLALLAAVGLFVALPAVRADSAHKARLARPISLGTSGGNINAFIRGGQFCESGTLGSLVQSADGTQYILSNNHVLARLNRAAIGEDINQPGLADVQCRQISADVVADLSAFVAINKTGTNTVDAAIAQVRADAVRTDGAILDVGTISGILAQDKVGCTVQKSGRTTGLTAGSISAVDATVKVRGEGTFVDQFVVTPGTFSAGGDSGSLIVRDGTTPRAVGLLFAGSSTSTIANPIAAVTSAFGVSMVGSDSDGSTGNCPEPPPPTGGAVTSGKAAKGQHADALLQLPDVVGVAVGTDGAVEVYLEQDNAQTRRRIPAALDGVPVRVIVTGPFDPR